MTVTTPPPAQPVLDDELGFDGDPFDGLRAVTPGQAGPPASASVRVPAPVAPPASAGWPTAGPGPAAPARPAPDTAGGLAAPTEASPASPAAGGASAAAVPAGDVAALVGEIRDVVAAAHDAALRAQDALARLLLAGPSGSRPPQAPAAGWQGTAAVAPVGSTPAGPTPTPAEVTAAPTHPIATEAAFKPLARYARGELGAADLAALRRGQVAEVFGPAYDQEGVNPRIRLDDLDAGPLLTWVADLRTRGGSHDRGELRAGLAGAPGQPPAGVALAAATQAAQVFAMYVGLHLCLADAGFVAGRPAEEPDGSPRVGDPPPEPAVSVLGAWDATGGELLLDVTDIDLVPRPWLAARARIYVAGRLVAEVTDVALTVRERPGAPVGPAVGGVVTAFLGRRNAAGERALLSEFHAAHCSRGDQGVALGPEFAGYRGRRATRLPGGGLRLVDRVMAIDGRRGELRGGASHITEYDAPADSWYFADTANASMPNVVYMETSLQAALMLGYYLGATLSEPDEDYSLRNLGGSATVLREVELRDATIRQHSTLRSTTPMPGATLQDFTYRLAVDGEPFYEGESSFGYFNATALARQTGLDGGRLAPTWLDAQDGERPEARVVDVAARRADPSAPLCARGQLALLDDLEVVDGGGLYGLGYLRASRPIDPQEWFFARHFYLDPVIPGSLGVESVIQAIQEWVVDAGHLAGFTRPGFVLPVGVTLHWKYRGQFLPSDELSTLEVHIKDVSRRPGRLRVTADASVWKPTMRIYGLTDVAVELRDEGAPPWLP